MTLQGISARLASHTHTLMLVCAYVCKIRANAVEMPII